MNEPSVRKHLRKYLQQQGYDVLSQEEKEVIPGVRADLLASPKRGHRRVLAVETKGSDGNPKQAVGQAATYLVSDLINESYVGIPEDLLRRSPYIRDVCEAVGVGLFEVKGTGEVSVEQHPSRKGPVSSASLWGNRRNGAPDTGRLADLKLAVLALAKKARTREQLISYIKQHRPRIGPNPVKGSWCEVFIDDATQMGLIIRRLDGMYVLSPLGRTILEINASPSILGLEKRLLSPALFSFPVAYMVFRILRKQGTGMSRREILEEGARLENQIGMDGIFQTELRKKYHLNEQRLHSTLGLMRDLGMLEAVDSAVELKLL